MSKRLNIGEIIGEYRVTGFLGAGGMGEVYAGVHEKLGRPVAVKVLGAAASGDETFKSRFFNEARLQANLHHPHIATLYDFQEMNGQLLIFMELVDGESLEEMVSRRAFTVEDALRAFTSVCEAVGYIHQHGILHRDIKSQNVKLNSGGEVKLLDFGIAKDSSNQHGLTQTGGVIGTPHYLAPEQLDGRPASPQTDIWALGVLLYEMLTGDLPFQGETLGSLVLQITQANFAAPEQINPAVPREVSGIVRRCLQKDAASRFQTADELARTAKNALNKEHGGTAGFFGFKKSPTQIAVSPPIHPPAEFVSESNPGFDDYSAAIPDAPAKKLPLVPIAIAASAAVILLFVAAGIAIWALSGADDGTFANTDVNDKKMITVQSGGSGTPHRIQVETDEGSAEVLRDGRSVGTTPYSFDARDGEKIPLTLRRKGFQDKEVELEVTNGKKNYSFQMKANE